MAQNFLTGINIVGDALSISGNSVISSARHAAFVNLTTTGDNTLGNATSDSTTINGKLITNGAILGGSDGANGGIRIHSGGTKFFSVNSSNAATNNVMDVGASDAKFKDAYFGGTVDAATIGSNTAALRGTSLTIDSRLTLHDGEIDNNSGDLTLDSAGDIILDADGGDIKLKDAGVSKHTISMQANGDTYFVNETADADIMIRGVDGSSTISAVTFDMSSAGSAFFNHDIVLVDNGKVTFGGGSDLQIYHDGSHNYIDATTTDQDIIFKGTDGGSDITALTLDMSEGGNATFAGNVDFSNNKGLTWAGSHSVRVESNILKMAASSGIQLQNATQIYYDGGGAAMGLDIHNSGTNAADDAKITFETQGQYDYIVGIDRSAGEFKISRSAAFGTNDVISLDSSSNATFAGDVTAEGSIASLDGSSQVFLGEYSNGAVIWLDGSDGDLSGGDYFGIHAYGTDTLAFSYGASTKMIMDNEGKLGLNGTTPNDYHNDADDLIVGSGSGNAGMTIRSGTTGYGSIFFADGTADDATEKRGQIRYLQGSEVMTFHTDNVATAALSLNLDQSATFAGHVLLADSKVLKIGTGADLQLEHNGSHSFITSNTGNLNIIENAGALNIINNTTDGNIVFTNDDGNGGTFDYFYLDGGSTTYASGATTAAYTIWKDNSRVTFGNDKNLSIFHDGNNNQIRNEIGNLDFEQHADNGDIRFYGDNGAGGVRCYFYMDGSLAADGGLCYTTFTDNSVLDFGDSQDLKISHQSGNSYIENGTGILNINNSGGNLVFDISGDITLDAGGNDIRLFKAGVEYGKFKNDSGNLAMYSSIQDEDIIFRGNDGGSIIDALTLDMSNGGSATFLDDVDIGKNLNLISASSPTIQVKDTTNNSILKMYAQDSNAIIGTYSNHPLAFYTDSGATLTLNTDHSVLFASTVETSGVFAAGNGAVGAPAFTFASDLNTGIYRTGADSIGFATGGSLALTIANNDATFAGRIADLHKKYCSASISNSYVRIYFADDSTNSAGGSEMGTIVRLTGTAHGTSHVGCFTALINVGHYQSVHIESFNNFYGTHTSGATNPILKVESDNNGSYTLSMKTASTNAATYYFTIECLTPESTITTLPSSTASTSTTHEHTMIQGSHSTGAGGYKGVKITGDLHIKQLDDAGFDEGFIIERSANTQKLIIGMDGGAVNFNSPDGLSYKFRNNGSEKFTIDSSGNITPQSRITFDYGGDHYMETGTDTLSFKASSGTVQSTFNFSDLSTTFAGNLTIPEYIYHSGDTDTYLRLETNNVVLAAGLAGYIQLESDGDIQIVPEYTTDNAVHYIELGRVAGSNSGSSTGDNPVHVTVLGGYSVDWSGGTRLSNEGFLMWHSGGGWTGNQRHWALTNAYDMGGTGGPKFALLLGDDSTTEPTLGSNGALGTNTSVATYWKNDKHLIHGGAATFNMGSGVATMTSTTSPLLVLNPTANNYGGIQFQYGGAVKGMSMYNSGMMVYGGESGVFTRLQAGGGYGLHIDATNQNVHVGSTSDTSYKLGVNGTFYASGDATFGGKVAVGGASQVANSAVLDVNIDQTNGALAAANTVHFGKHGAHTDGQISGITLGYKENGNASYRKLAIVSEGRGDGAARQNLHLLVDIAADSGSAALTDSKLKIDGLTGVTTLNGTSTSARFSVGGDVSVLGSTDFTIPTGRKLLLDGAGGHTYIMEEGDNNMKFYVGGSEHMAVGGGNVTIKPSSTFTVDAGGQVNLDAGNAEIHLKGSGTTFGKLFTSGSDFYINHPVSDEDIIFSGNDGGSSITALTLDMSEAGKATFNNDVVAFSDRKLKKDIKTLDGSKVYDMRGVSFTRKDTGKDGSGVIAQELQEIAPELVNETNGTLGVSYGNITGYLIEAIKDLKAEIEELKKCNKCENCNCENK